MNAVRTSGLQVPKLDADPNSNLSLSSAISVAKQNQVPKARIEALIKNASGDKSSDVLVGRLCEIMCKGGVAMLVECLTDNRNRLNQELKFNVGKFGGNMSAEVMYLFEKKGRVVVAKGDSGLDINGIVETIIEEVDDIEDMKCIEGERVEIICAVKSMIKVRNSIQSLKLDVQALEVFYDSRDKIDLDNECGLAFGSLLEYLENHDDVVKVHHNCQE